MGHEPAPARAPPGKLLESAMNVPMLLGLVAVLVGADWRPVLAAVAVLVRPLWALQVRVRRTGLPARLTPRSVRPRAGERLGGGR